MQINKIRSYVGFAIRSGKALFGVDNIVGARRDPFLVLYDDRLKENSTKKLLRRCENFKVIRLALQEILPGRNCLAIGICDKNLAQAIINEVEENS